jgi:hypothetical protein
MLFAYNLIVSVLFDDRKYAVIKFVLNKLYPIMKTMQGQLPIPYRIILVCFYLMMIIIFKEQSSRTVPFLYISKMIFNYPNRTGEL